jgi:hypothetical protein
VTALVSQSQYWTSSGRSRPSLVIWAWTASGVALNPRVVRAIPGPLRNIRQKVAKVTTRNTARERPTLFSNNMA